MGEMRMRTSNKNKGFILIFEVNGQKIKMQFSFIKPTYENNLTDNWDKGLKEKLGIK